ncbi:MAG TPA: carboxylate--amine ligase [Bacilli bacterium]|nr:carboxylate--amine ligase [Bacilli bacterium]
MKKNDFKVVILGTDINAYYMSRNFHEEYGIKAHLIGKTAMNFTSMSNILTYELYEDLWDKKTFLKALNKYGEENKKSKIVLIGSNDTYVRLIVENRKELEKYYTFNYPSLKIINNLLIKDNFYKFVKDYDIDIPNTYIYKCNNDKLDLKELKKLNFPIILKPGDGVKYHEHEFPNQAKVYKLNTNEEIKEIVKKIEESGYDDNLIMQEFIPGDDSMLFDSIFYVGKDKKAKLMSFAQIGLQEHTPTGIGNCTVLVNGYNEFDNTDIIKDRLIKFLEDIGYQGFAEFDLKYDVRDNKFKIFEINPRQARSSYYLTACGYNLAKYLVDDIIYNKEIKFKFIKEKMVLSFVPKSVIRKYVENNKLKEEINELIKQHKFVRPLNYKGDRHLKRKLWLFMRDINYNKKYKNNKW